MDIINNLHIARHNKFKIYHLNENIAAKYSKIEFS